MEKRGASASGELKYDTILIIWVRDVVGGDSWQGWG